jgi:DNA-binding LacI/PurR family transcriptional regulator
MGRVTLQTVADAVGVSRMTVSNAFSRPDQLSADLRDRILAAAAELGYVGPDPAARALARGSTGVVGVVFTTELRIAFSDDVAAAFLGAIVDGLAPSGLSLALLSTGETGGRIPTRDVPMDATLVFSCAPGTAELDWLVRRRLPLVFVDQQPQPGLPSVNVDDRGGARLAAEHLLALGHRRIGIVTMGGAAPFGVQAADGGPLGVYVTDQRMLGWQDALGAAGIEPVVVRQPKVPYHPQEYGRQALGLLLEADSGTTAVLCFADSLAHGVMLAAQDRGLSVPDDLSVVGFDDNALAPSLRLTTVHQDIDEKGRLAATALVAAADRKAPSPADSAAPDGQLQVLLPTRLVVRDSTAGPRRSGAARRRTVTERAAPGRRRRADNP